MQFNGLSAMNPGQQDWLCFKVLRDYCMQYVEQVKLFFTVSPRTPICLGSIRTKKTNGWSHGLNACPTRESWT